MNDELREQVAKIIMEMTDADTNDATAAAVRILAHPLIATALDALNHYARDIPTPRSA